MTNAFESPFYEKIFALRMSDVVDTFPSIVPCKGTVMFLPEEHFAVQNCRNENNVVIYRVQGRVSTRLFGLEKCNIEEIYMLKNDKKTQKRKQGFRSKDTGLPVWRRGGVNLRQK